MPTVNLVNFSRIAAGDVVLDVGSGTLMPTVNLVNFSRIAAGDVVLDVGSGTLMPKIIKPTLLIHGGYLLNYN